MKVCLHLVAAYRATSFRSGFKFGECLHLYVIWRGRAFADLGTLSVYTNLNFASFSRVSSFLVRTSAHWSHRNISVLARWILEHRAKTIVRYGKMMWKLCVWRVFSGIVRSEFFRPYLTLGVMDRIPHSDYGFVYGVHVSHKYAAWVEFR